MGSGRFLRFCWLGVALMSTAATDGRFGAARGQDGRTHQPPLGEASKLPEADEQRLSRERQAVQTKPIYNADDRMDLGTIWDPKLKKIASATVALFEPSALVKSADGSYKINAPTLGKRYGLCKGERFENQISGAYCSGVLIAPDVVLTAGHCVNELKKENEPLATEAHYVFGFSAKDDKDPGVDSFPASRVFKGKALIRGQLKPVAAGGDDWAMVRLGRKVPSDIAEPVSAISNKKIANDASVYVMGHPSRLPLKYAGDAKITVNAATAYFTANLDTFGGNSGSGVFVKDSNVLVGILVRGFTDYYRTPDNCSKAYLCGSAGCTGEEVTRVERLDLQ